MTAAAEKVLAEFKAVHVLVNGAAGHDPNGTVLDLSLARLEPRDGGQCRRRVPDEPRVPAGDDRGRRRQHHPSSRRSSAASRRPRRAVYCATKGALIQLAKAMATDHAAQNVRVNTLSPGAVETGAAGASASATWRRRGASSGPKHLLGRLGQPDEIAAAAVFLASDASSFMTGADLLVDGGYNAT